MKAGAVLEVGARTVGEGHPCFVLAHVGSAHEGSGDTALRMIEAAFKMGADGILFEVFRSEHLVVRRHPERCLLDEVELGAREWKRVLGAAKASGLAVLVEPLDLPSLELAAEAEADGFQVHGTDMENPEFIRAVGGRRRPVLLAIGGVPEAAVREATGLLGGAPAGFVHGFPSSPAPPEELCFRDIDTWKERYRVPVGFRDLTDGGSAFALVAPALAVAHGADFVEKHFTLDRTRKGHDYQSSVSPEDFYRMVELLRQAERAEGDSPRGESEGAVRSRRLLARSIVAGALIPRGEVLTAPMLAYKRTDARYPPGFPPKEAHRVIGRRAARPIQADETIREDMLE
jgi:N,N'-diacetyllegionaminate synthase